MYNQGRPTDTGENTIPEQRLCQSPKKSTVTVRKKRDKLLSMDSVIFQVLPTKFGRKSQPSSQDHSQNENHRRTVSARLVSSSYSEAPTTITRQSSTKHRMLNRLASGLLSDTVMTAPPIPQRSEPPTLEPKRQQITRAFLNVHQADVGADNSVFLGVDVGCTFEAKGALPLNVAIVIDNSVYSSPATLLANCEATSFIISCLLSQDHVAVYCTCPTTSDPLWVGQFPNVRSVLDSIVGETSRPKASYLRRAVEAAAAKLAPKTNSTPSSEPAALGHLFVFTSNTFALDKLLPNTQYQIHTICAGPIPWSLAQPSSPVNGWCITNSPSKLRDSRRRESALCTQLRLLMNSARSGHSPDQLRNVSVSVTSGPSNAIEGVLGSTCFASLRPGEIRTVLVKAHLATSPASPLLDFPRGFVTPSGTIDLDRELGATLKDQPTPALTVQLKYEHSALPTETTCEANQNVRLVPSTGSHEVVQARLAFHLAMSQNPRRGLAALKNQFTGCSSEYVQALMDELKYQARVLERFEHTRYSPRKRLPASTQGSSNANPSQIDLYAFPAPPAPLRPRRKESEDDDDPAHQIWADLKVRKSPNNNRTVLRKASTASLRQIKQTAENNRRSVAPDSLRSLRYEKRQENVAPWL